RAADADLESVSAKLRVQRVCEVEAPDARRAWRRGSEKAHSGGHPQRRVHAVRDIARPEAAALEKRADTHVGEPIRPAEVLPRLQPRHGTPGAWSARSREPA